MPRSRDRHALTRRAFGLGAGALAASAGLGPAFAQAMNCVIGTWGGDYQSLLDANIVKPLLEPKGVAAQWDVGERTLNHWFDGFAMLHRFQLSECNVSYANRFLQT